MNPTATVAPRGSLWPRRLFWLGWAALPVGVVCFHLSAGQPLTARDHAASLLAQAKAMLAEATADPDEVDKDKCHQAAALFADARNALPVDAAADVGGRARLQLAEAKARITAGDLVEGQQILETLLTDQLAAPTPDADLVKTVRHEFGSISYYIAYAMRLENAAEDEWRAESERARQQFRLLAETAAGVTGAATDEDAALFKRNLENVIRFEQMTDEEFRAQKRPKNCNCNGSCSQQKRSQSLSKSKGKGKGPDDVRKDIAKGAAESAKRGNGS